MAYLEFPIGTIIAWKNLEIPEKWKVCDGIDTPNLIGKFIMGASVDEDVGTTGGALTHTHVNPNTSTRGAHNHGGSKAANVSGASGTSVNSGTGATATNASHTHTGTVYIGNGGAHAHTIGNTGGASSLPVHIKRVFIRKMS